LNIMTALRQCLADRDMGIDMAVCPNTGNHDMQDGAPSLIGPYCPLVTVPTKSRLSCYWR
jgi:hypothetical protein